MPIMPVFLALTRWCTRPEKSVEIALGNKMSLGLGAPMPAFRLQKLLFSTQAKESPQMQWLTFSSVILKKKIPSITISVSSNIGPIIFGVH
jgi:hypothetical protein